MADNKKRVCAYCRVGTANEDNQLMSEIQKEYYENLIDSHTDWELKNIYFDEGFVGIHPDRPEFSKMIDDCRKGKIDLIITKSISRFSGNLAECLNLVNELKSIGVEIYFEKENIKTLGASGELFIKILSTIAELQ